MVVLKYKKVDEGMFVSYVNVIRIWNIILNISSVKVNYSEASAKKLWFSPPVRVGIESKCEYIVIDTDDSASNVESALENNLPEWIKIEKVWQVKKNPNIFAKCEFSEYKISFSEYKTCKAKVKEFFEQDKIVISGMVHGEEKMIDAKPRIKSFSLEDEEIKLVVSMGEKGVRVDELVKDLLKFVGKSSNDYDIVKKEMFYAEGENLVSIDKHIENCQ